MPSKELSFVLDRLRRPETLKRVGKGDAISSVIHIDLHHLSRLAEIVLRGSETRIKLSLGANELSFLPPDGSESPQVIIIYENF